MNNDLNYINNQINYCSNCGKSGHIYKNCKNPIISYGIMLFKYYNNNLHLFISAKKGFNIIYRIYKRKIFNN